MKGARRTRTRQGAGFADLMGVPPQPRRGVITGMSRFQQQSNSNTPTATAQTTPNSSTPSTPRPSPPDEDWDSLLHISPRRRISPVKSKLGSRSRPGSTSMDTIPHRTPKVSSLKLSSSRQSMPPLSSPPPVTTSELPQLSSISPRKETKPSQSARSSLAPVPSFLAGWEGNDGWADDPLDESDPEVDEDAWGGWGDTTEITIPDEMPDSKVSEAAPSPATESSASQILTKQEPLVVEAAEQSKGAADVGSHTVLPEVPAQQSTPGNYEARAPVLNHLNQSERKETEPYDQPITSIFAEEENPVTEPDAPAPNTDNDEAWAEWEETGDVSVQPIHSVAREEVSFDEQPEHISVHQATQGEDDRLVGEIHSSTAPSGASVVKHEEPKVLEDTSVVQTNVSISEKKNPDEANVEHEVFLDEQFEAVSGPIDNQLSERDGDNAIDPGALGEWEKLDDTSVAMESGCISGKILDKNAEHPQLESTEAMPFPPAPEDGERSTVFTTQFLDEESLVDRHPTDNTTNVIPEVERQNGVTETAKVRSEAFETAFGVEDGNVAEPQPVEEAGEVVTDEGAWGEWTDISDFPSQQSPDELGSDGFAESAKQSSPHSLGLQVEQETTKTPILGDVAKHQVFEQRETEAVPYGERQCPVPKEENSPTQGSPNPVEPDLACFDVGVDSAGQELGSFDIQDCGAEPSEGEWAGWGEFEETVAPQNQETSPTIRKENFPEELVSETQLTHRSENPEELLQDGRNRSPKSSSSSIPVDPTQQIGVDEEFDGALGHSLEQTNKSTREETHSTSFRPAPPFFEPPAREGNVDGVLSLPREEEPVIGQEEVKGEDVAFDSTAIALGTLTNDKKQDDNEGDWEQWGDFGDISASAQRNIGIPDRGQHDFSQKPAQHMNIDATSAVEVKSEMPQPENMFLVEASGLQSEANVRNETPCAAPDESQESSTQYAVDSTTEPVPPSPATWNASLPKRVNDKQNQESVPSDIWGEWDNAQDVPIPERRVVNGSIEERKEDKPLTLSSESHDPSDYSQTMPDVRERAPSSNLDNMPVDEAFFSVPAGNAEQSDPVPFEEISGDDDDIWGGWDQVGGYPDETEGVMTNPSEQDEASSLLSPVVSKQQGIRVDRNEDALANDEVGQDVHQPVEKSAGGEKGRDKVGQYVQQPIEKSIGGGEGSPLDESPVPITEHSYHHDGNEGVDSTAFDLTENAIESKPQVAFSTSYWTEKLNSANVQEHDSKGSSSFMTSTHAYSADKSQGTADFLQAEASTTPGLEEQCLNYDPFAPGEDIDPPNQSSFDGFNIAGGPAVDETTWYQQENENTETVKLRTDAFKTNEPNVEHLSFNATPQSELTDKNGVSRVPGVVRKSEGLDSDPALDRACDPYRPTDAVAAAFDQSQPTVLETAVDRPSSRNASSSNRMPLVPTSHALVEPGDGARNNFGEVSHAEDPGLSHGFPSFLSPAQPPGCDEKASHDQQFNMVEPYRKPDAAEAMDGSAPLHSDAPFVEASFDIDNVPNEANQYDSILKTPGEQQHPKSNYPGTDVSELEKDITGEAPLPPTSNETNGNQYKQSVGAFESEPSFVPASTKTDFEISPYAPKEFRENNGVSNIHEDSRLRGALEHDSEDNEDRHQALGDSNPSSHPEASSFGEESDFRVYAPKPSQALSGFAENGQDSHAPPLLENETVSLQSTGRFAPFAEEASHMANMGAIESEVNLSEPTQFISTASDFPEPYKAVPANSDIDDSFEPQQTSISEDIRDSEANYAPRQRFPAVPSEHRVERNVPFAEPYPAPPQEQGLSTQGTKETHNSHTEDEPYSTAAYQATPNDVSAAYWGHGAEEQRSMETSAVDKGLSVSAEDHASSLSFRPYEPATKNSLPSYETAPDLNPVISSHPVEAFIPNAYGYEDYGNYTASTPAIPETQQDSTYLDPSLFSYPFSIMDTNPSGDMIHPGARPIISWSFVGSFVTVFPSTESELMDGAPLTQNNGNNCNQRVQVFDVSPLGGDGTNDDWVAAAEAVEPLSYPVQAPELESYARMCDGLSQLSVGLHGPAAESRAALWRVLGLLCRTTDEDWRRSASQAVCGPTSVPLFGNKLKASSTLKHIDESAPSKSEVSERDVTNEVEQLLTEGKGVDAVNHAKTSGLWSLALVLAEMIDRKLYMSVLCDFAKVNLHEGSALQTLCLSLSENDSEITRRITSPAGLTEWRKNVGMLLTSGASITRDSEKSKRFMSLIDQVGDALLAQNEDVVGSHVCYLLSGRLDSLDRNQICLLGANSKTTPGRPGSFGSPAAILQSIVFEATINARNGKTCPHILPFRLLLALEIASVGRPEVALAHCNSISKEVRAIFESGNSVAAQLFTSPFLSCLESFEHQLRINLGVQEKGEKQTRLSALRQSLTSVFARRSKDQTGKQSSQELGSQNTMAGSQPFVPTPPVGPGHIHAPSDHVHANHPPHLSLDSQRAGIFNPAQISQLPNQANEAFDQSAKKEKSGNEKWNYLVQKTVGLIAPADYDLSPPPPARAPPAVFCGQGHPSPFGLDGGAGTRAPGQGLTPSHMRSASVGALPSEYFSSSQFASKTEVASGQRIQSYEDGRHASTPQMDISSDKTDQTLFNGVPVQKVTREEESDALVHRRSASDMTLQSQTSEKKPPLHPKKPVRATKQTDTSMEKTASKKGWRERLREKLTAAFSGSGPPRAHMGEENKFVFDKQRGRWIIEGEDPDEEEDVPPPPPDDDNMFSSDGSNVQTSASYDLLPNPSNNDHNTTALLRSQSAQDARDMNSFNMSNSHDQIATPFNPLSSYPGSLDNSVGGDDGSATSVASAASAPVPYSAVPSFTASSTGNSNKYRAGGGRRSNRRAYVDTFNKGRPPAPMSTIPTPARPAVPAFGGVSSASGGGYKIFTPTPVPSSSTGNSDVGHGANSSASVVETSDPMPASGSDISSSQNAPMTNSSHSDALPPKPPSYTSSLGSGRQPRMMA